MTTSNDTLNYADIAEEIRKISHNMRSALSVLQVGAQVLERSNADDTNIAPLMLVKITQVDNFCNRLTELSEKLKV